MPIGHHPHAGQLLIDKRLDQLPNQSTNGRNVVLKVHN